jgi:hypothetical protein
MPDYEGRLERAVSGFGVRISGAPTIWEELEQRDRSYTLFNAAFRKDPVWEKSYSSFDLLLDGYRNYLPDSSWIRIGAGQERRGKVFHRKNFVPLSLIPPPCSFVERSTRQIRTDRTRVHLSRQPVSFFQEYRRAVHR